MKKEKEDIPLQYFERSILYIIFFVGLTAFLVYLTYLHFKAFSPLMFVWGVPAIIFFFQTLLILLNPFAIIYEDKFEIKRTMLSNKQWHFVDIKKVTEAESKGFRIVYNDGDEELISTFGIRASQKKKFRDAINHHVCKSLVVERADD